MFLKLTRVWSDEFGRKKRKKQNINLNPNIIFYQGEAYKGLGGKNPKTTAFEYELSPTTLLLLYSVGIPNVTHLHILGPNCNPRVKPWQEALLEERFQCNHRKLKKSSWHDAELSAKAKPAWREGWCCCCQGWVQGSVHLDLAPVWWVQVSLHNNFHPARAVRQLEWALGQEMQQRPQNLVGHQHPLLPFPTSVGAFNSI